MSKPIVKIYDIMACNVYMDFENTGLQKEQHKFLIAFYPTGGTPLPELIERITARGPDGYEVQFINQEFTARNRNGFIFDRTTNAHGYMVNLDSGFMKEGEYTIEAKCKDGKVVSTSRIQKNAPSDALVAAYKANRQKIYDSYSPAHGQQLADSSGLKDIGVTWTPLKKLCDQDAYYIFRLSEGRSSKEFNTQHLAWWDNIFLQRMTGNAQAGLNKEGVVIAAALKPGTSYVHFTEITDSNAMGETNICIFQPHQTFVTASVTRQSDASAVGAEAG